MEFFSIPDTKLQPVRKHRFRLLCTLMIGLLFSGSACRQLNKPMYDADGMIRIHGKRTFLLGLYQKPNIPDAYNFMAAQGFNLVNLPADTRMLDSAKTAGLLGWVTLGTIDTNQREKSWNQIHSNIEKLKSHLALFAWELADEPAWTWNSNKQRLSPELMEETHDSVKKQDPLHPIYLNHAPVNLAETMKRYNASTDITACDIYPVIPVGIKPMFALNPDGLQGDLPNTTISQVGDYVDKMRKVSGPNRPLLMVLQGFSWEMLRPTGERDTSKIRYPSYGESWFMAWDAIIHGANGLIWWGTAFTPKGHRFHSDLATVVRNLSSLQEALSLPCQSHEIFINYLEMGHSISKGIEILVKQKGDTTWILTANTERYPVHAELHLHVAEGTAEVLFENRFASIHKNQISENYEPYEVHIYKLIQTK